MVTLKEKVKQEIDSINDEGLLMEVFKMVHGMRETHIPIVLNDAQRHIVHEALEQYGKGEFLTTDEVFRDLFLGDEE